MDTEVEKTYIVHLMSLMPDEVAYIQFALERILPNYEEDRHNLKINGVDFFISRDEAEALLAGIRKVCMHAAVSRMMGV